MKFLCLICAEAVMEQLPKADADKHFQEYVEFTERIRTSGHFVGANRLKPPKTGTTVRVRDGKVLTTDGPFAETGGYYLIEARDVNERSRWPRGFPGPDSAASRRDRSRTTPRRSRSGSTGRPPQTSRPSRPVSAKRIRTIHLAPSKAVMAISSTVNSWPSCCQPASQKSRPRRDVLGWTRVTWGGNVAARNGG